MKKVLALALAIIMIASMIPALTIFAGDPTEITSADDFYAMFIDDTTHITGSFKLMNDITITHGLSAGKEQAVFEGVFDGNGHTITVDFRNVNARTGVFCTAGGEGCTIKNLTVDGKITSTGNSAGGVVGTAKGQITFENVTSKVTIQATGDSDGSCGNGGILGANEGQTVTFKNCESRAEVTGVRSAGGFIGLVRNAGAKEIFENCVFTGVAVCATQWTDKRAAGGFIGILHKDTGDEVDVTFNGCQSNGIVSADVLASAWVGSYSRYGHRDEGLPKFDENCTQTAEVYIAGYRISDACETRYPEGHDNQVSGNVSYDTEAKTVSGWGNFAIHPDDAAAYGALEGNKVFVNGVLDESASLTVDGRRFKVTSNDPTVTEGTTTSILVVFANGHYTTLGQTYECGSDRTAKFTATGANAGVEGKTLGYSIDARRLVPANRYDGYVIETPEEFSAFTKDLNSNMFSIEKNIRVTVKVGADLDMRDITDFEPINRLTCILDFDGHTVSNLVETNNGTDNFAGLIANKSCNHVGVINLKLKNCKLITENVNTVGIVLGLGDRTIANNIDIENVTVDATGAKTVGGVIGARDWGTELTKEMSATLNDVIFNVDGAENIGILIGTRGGDAQVDVKNVKATKIQINNNADGFDPAAVGVCATAEGINTDNATIEITLDTGAVPAVGYVEPVEPTETDEPTETGDPTETGEPTNTQTGDLAAIAIATVAVVSLAGVAVVASRRRKIED